MLENVTLPHWNEREQPTGTTRDGHIPGHDYSVLLASDGTLDDATLGGYMAWILGTKMPLHDSLRAVHPKTVERLAARGIDLSAINDAVADVTGRPVYPIERVVTASDLRADPNYCAAAQDGFFPKSMKYGDNTLAHGQFEFMMHFIRFRQTYLNRAGKNHVVDTVAHFIGAATLAPMTYFHFEKRETGNKAYHWYGYTWRYDNQYYGRLLEEASAAKIAATTRRKLGRAGIAAGPEIYQGTNGFPYGAMGALVLDTLNRAAGYRQNDLVIYRPVWAFMVNRQDEGARAELADMVARATDQQVLLEDLEANQPTDKESSLALLERVEEACQVDTADRASRLVREAGIQ